MRNNYITEILAQQAGKGHQTSMHTRTTKLRGKRLQEEDKPQMNQSDPSKQIGAKDENISNQKHSLLGAQSTVKTRFEYG